MTIDENWTGHLKRSTNKMRLFDQSSVIFFKCSRIFFISEKIDFCIDRVKYPTPLFIRIVSKYEINVNVKARANKRECDSQLTRSIIIDSFSSISLRVNKSM